jgi:hypothetical protein
LTTSNENIGNGNHDGERIVLVLEYDPHTHQVTIGGTPIQISLAQMICDEAQRVLAEQRRMAALHALQQAAADQAIARNVFGRRGN